MDCKSCQGGSMGPRPQKPVPPCMNTNCDCGCRPPRPACNSGSGSMVPPMQPNRPLSPGCAGNGMPAGVFPTYTPIGMGYVPMQQWGQLYPAGTGFQRGTIFPELDLPFQMGRCRS